MLDLELWKKEQKKNIKRVSKEELSEYIGKKYGLI
jgi:hypothetical protein